MQKKTFINYINYVFFDHSLYYFHYTNHDKMRSSDNFV